MICSVLKTAFTITRGEISWFHSSDLARRGFCRDCGTPMIFDDSEHLDCLWAALMTQVPFLRLFSTAAKAKSGGSQASRHCPAMLQHTPLIQMDTFHGSGLQPSAS